MEPVESTRLVGIGEIAKRLGVSTSWVRSLALQGRIPFELSPGGHRRFDIAVVERLMRGGRSWRRQFGLRGLREDAVWNELSAAVFGPGSQSVSPAVNVMHYAFTEMLNNSIDHSEGATVDVAWNSDETTHRFEIQDDGIGVFLKVQSRLGLPDLFAAVQELSKGKVTTDAQRHSGEGIFFTSKAVDRFRLAANALAWTVDNQIQDQAVGDDPEAARGTRVTAEIAVGSTTQLQQVFDRYTGEDYRFNRTVATVKLFEHGSTFVSRSEAKRLLNRMDEFTEVIVDFRGVTEVGQGFVDEVFRVWTSEHPTTRVMPANMSPAVEAMVRRGLASRDQREM